MKWKPPPGTHAPEWLKRACRRGKRSRERVADRKFNMGGHWWTRSFVDGCSAGVELFLQWTMSTPTMSRRRWLYS